MIHLARVPLGVVLASVLAASPAVAQMEPAPVTLADGRKLMMACVGEGGPTILLDAGMGLPLEVWNKVAPELGKTARTCAYSRAGYTGSDPGPMPRDAAHMVDDIRALVVAARLPAPYIVVAQSLGGHNARLFAARYPEEVAGVVLVDPITDREDLLRAARVAANGGKEAPEAMVSLCVRTRARGETWSAADPAYTECGPPPKLPAPAAEIAMARAVASEWDHMNEGPAQIRAAQTGPARYPILVLTADDAARRGPAFAGEQAAKVEQHRAIAATSLAGEQRTLAGASHMMQWDQPQLVINAVREVAARHRGGRAAVDDVVVRTFNPGPAEPWVEVYSASCAGQQLEVRRPIRPRAGAQVLLGGQPARSELRPLELELSDPRAAYRFSFTCDQREGKLYLRWVRGAAQQAGGVLYRGGIATFQQGTLIESRSEESNEESFWYR